MSHLRRNPVPYLALLLVLAVGVGGGYALAASNTKTITVCADKKTGVLHLKTRGRCKSSQTRVTGTSRVRRGCRVRRGRKVLRGAAARRGRWRPGAGGGQRLGERRGQRNGHRRSGLCGTARSAGTYQVTITDPTCAHANNAPVVSVSDCGSSGWSSGGVFPSAWYGGDGRATSSSWCSPALCRRARVDVHGDRPHVRHPGHMPVRAYRVGPP